MRFLTMIPQGTLEPRFQAIATTPRVAAYTLLGTDTALTSLMLLSGSRSPCD
jgi:hypothetical protein